MTTNNCAMSEAAKAAQREYKREYMRKWRAANKEKVAAINCKYWESKAQKARCEEYAEVAETKR